MKSKAPDIKVVGASVTGALHRQQKMPCQDCFKHARGKNFVAVVSDGAGSARYGKIGAKTVCATLCDLLKDAAFGRIKEQTAKAVSIAREKLIRHRLNKNKCESGLNDFAATVVGFVYRRGEGLFFHIGDGATIALNDSDCQDFVASRPENGSFSCETYFFTQPQWAENLRFTPIKNAETIFLMSDGLTNFSFINDYKDIDKGFISPINAFLSQACGQEKARRALANTLNLPRAQKLNPDDKTLVWAKVK